MQHPESEPQETPTGFGAPARLRKDDVLPMLFLIVFTLLLEGYRLGALEFFRHTEADRTLIAWEMMQRGNYVIPQLIGSAIVTKPPLFYWALVGSFRLFGAVSEWTARVPSVLFSVLFVLLQYVAVRRIGGDRTQGLLSALMVATGMLFMLLGSVAEIDMMFGLFCAGALYALFFALHERSPALFCVSYVAAGIAFLIKGPPIVFFFAAALCTFYLWQRRMRPVQCVSLRELLVWNAVGAGIFSVMALVWLSMVAERLGWPVLYHEFNVEVFQRVVAPARQERGALFYLKSLAAGLAPWTVLLIIGAVELARREGRARMADSLALLPPALRSFIAFSVLTAVSGLIMLSVAQSKSSRYIFPIYPFAMNLAFAQLVLLRVSGRFKASLRWLRYAAPLGGAAGFAAVGWYVVHGLSGVSAISVGVFAAFLAAALLGIWRGFSDANQRMMFISTLVLVMAVRIGERDIFVPYRNALRSVKPLAAEIDGLVPKGLPIYTIEMFERWIVYYMKHLGRETLRITPELAQQTSGESRRIYLLLNNDEESWRVPQLGLHDPTLKVIRRFNQGKDSPLLVEVDARVLLAVRPHETFPTFPTPPYYTEEEKNLLQVQDGEFPRNAVSREQS